MFENLNSRERILAWTVLSLVPIGILFVGVFSFINTYNANNIQIGTLGEQIDRETDKMLAAKKADVRRNYYQAVSLPSNVVNASNDYQNWLLKLVRDELKMDFKSLTPRDAGDLKFQTKMIGKAKTYTVLASADLKQLAQFLYKFYSVDLLHRINSMKINPESIGASGGKKIRTGKLSLIITIEAISLLDADVDRDFANEFRQLARTEDDYQQSILRRNIFGPANNTPTLSIRPSSSYTSESDIKVNLTADDADESDVLSFELLESAVEGVKIVQTDAKSRRAALEIPGQQAGTYEFKIGVMDSGFPSKQNEEIVKVTFKDRVVAAPPTPPPPKPKFLHAKETQITAIVKDKLDHWIVWIKVRTTGERFQLQAGESFELDDQTWTVHLIEPNQAVMQVENRLLTFRPADPFHEPRATTKIESNDKSNLELETKLESNGTPGAAKLENET